MRTTRQERVVADLARDAMLHGFLDPYIAERHRRRGEKVQHALDLAVLYPVAKFVIEACIAGLTYDAIKKALKLAFKKQKRVTVYERGSTNHQTRTISIGHRKIGTITMSEALQERILQGMMQRLSAPSKKKALAKVPALEELPPPLPKKRPTNKAPTSRSTVRRTAAR